MFQSEEYPKKFTFLDRFSSEQASKDFATQYLQTGSAKLSYEPKFNQLEQSLNFIDYSKSISKELSIFAHQSIDFPQSKLANLESMRTISFAQSEFPLMQKNDYSTTPLEFHPNEFLMRTLSMQTTQFALHALQEESLRLKTLSSMMIDIRSILTSPNKVVLEVSGSQLRNWINRVDFELRNLYNQVGPIGKATLPSKLMLEQNHKEVLELMMKGEYLKAQVRFGIQLQEKYYLSGEILDKLKFIGKGLGVVSATSVAYRVGTSEDKVTAAEKEAVSFVGGFVAGWQAGKLALPYCSKLIHPLAKTACQAGAVMVGSIVGTEAVNDIFQKTTNKNEEASAELLSNARHSTMFKSVETEKPLTTEIPKPQVIEMPTLDEFYEKSPETLIFMIP